MKKEIKILCAILGMVIIVLAICLTFFIMNKSKKEETVEQPNNVVEKDVYGDKKQKLKEIPENITAREAADKGYFVYDGQSEKIYNKELLEEFIVNAEEYATNRVTDEIILAIYNTDGKPRIHYLEYVVDKDDKEKTKYILITDNSRSNNEANNLDIIVNDNIPGEYYKIAITEDLDICITTISLIVNEESISEKDYKEIEIVRYSIYADEIK